MDLGAGWACSTTSERRGELDAMLARARAICPRRSASDLKATGVATTAAWDGAPDAVRGRVPADARTGKCTCSPRSSTRRRPPGSTATSPTRRPTEFPLALISPASRPHDQLDARRAAAAGSAVADASRRCGGARDRGRRRRSRLERAGRSAVPGAGGHVDPAGNGRPAERAVAAAHGQRLHRERARAGYADRLGGGACFNDARVQVERAGGRKAAPGGA